MLSVSCFDNKPINECPFRDNQTEMCSYKPQWNKMLNWRCMRGFWFQRVQEWKGFLTSLTWSSQEHTIGPKQTRVSGWDDVLSESGTDSGWRGEPPGCRTPPLLSLHKRASPHPDWLGGEHPKLLPLLSQESVSTFLHSGDLNHLQSVHRDFQNPPKTKKDRESKTKRLFIVSTLHLRSAVMWTQYPAEHANISHSTAQAWCYDVRWIEGRWLVSIFPFVSVQVPLEHHSVSVEFQGEKDGFPATTEPFCQRSHQYCATLNRDEERSEMSDCFAASIINSAEKLCYLLIRISKWVFTCRRRLMRYMICSFLPICC